MNWNTATVNEIADKARAQMNRGAGFTVSPKVLLRLIYERHLLAMLAAKEPMFDNPMLAFRAEMLRDDILQSEVTVAQPTTRSEQ